MAVRADQISLSAERPAAALILTLRRAALWGLFVAKLIGGWGVQWDIQWHLRIGRDSFWIAPHLMTYGGVALVVALSWGIVAWESVLARRHPRHDTIRLLGLTATRGFHLAAWGIALTVLAAPIDDLWHRLFGLDVTIWSPPHLLGIVGAAVNTVGCLLIATEVYPLDRGRRLFAVVLFGAMLYGTLHLVVDPSNLVAYRRGGVFFYTLAFFSALLLPLALVTTARVARTSWAPVLIVAIIVPVGIVGGVVSRVGFDVLQPVSFIREEIAKDPESPIAVAYEIARKNGTLPGRAAGTWHLLALLPAAAMAAVDPRRRPIPATMAYAALLFVLVGLLLSGRPAFAALVPGLLETAVALAVVLVAAATSAIAARRLSNALTSPARAA